MKATVIVVLSLAILSEFGTVFEDTRDNKPMVVLGGIIRMVMGTLALVFVCVGM